VAVLHGLGAGSDTKAAWMLMLTAACVLVVVAAVWARATRGWPANIGSRVSAIAASTILPLALVAWLPGGPLGTGWARRSGTPASLLGTAAAARPSRASRAAAHAGGQRPFNAAVTGSVSQSEVGGGLVRIDLGLSVPGQHLGTLHIAIEGVPLDGGGVNMTASDVRLGTGSDPGLYRGSVTALSGNSVTARLVGPQGARLSLVANLDINPGTGAVSGQVNVAPAAA
jgi:hypothetical protein